MAAERGVPLAVDAGDRAAWSMADHDRIVQVLLVLIDNAVDHSPAGRPGHGPRPGHGRAR